MKKIEMPTLEELQIISSRLKIRIAINHMG